MSETTTLSTVIDSGVKEALVKFCKKRGIKLRYLIEQALIEQLEDEIDFEAHRERRDEETVPFDEVTQRLRKRKR